MGMWEETREIVKDSETLAGIIGVQTMMLSFEYLFGLVFGERILKHSDNLSKTLQNPLLTATEGQQVAELTCQTLERIRTTESFDLFWQNLMLLQTEKGVNAPTLPRKRKCPSQYEVGTSAGYYPGTAKEYYRQHYFECLDTIVNCIRDRFNQPGYRVLKNLENLLLKAVRNEDYTSELDFVLDFYKDDLVHSSVCPQLELLTTTFSSYENKPTLMEVRDYFKSLSPAQRSCMSKIITLLKLIMVIPATNAVSERSASGVCRVKSTQYIEYSGLQ